METERNAERPRELFSKIWDEDNEIITTVEEIFGKCKLIKLILFHINLLNYFIAVCSSVPRNYERTTLSAKLNEADGI